MSNTDLDILKSACVKAGAIAKSFYDAGGAKTWDKYENHPVTEADIAVNDYLLDVLMSARPDYGWLSEETKDDSSRHQKPRCFVVDPIDGTRAFIDKRPHFVISVAVIENGEAVAGVVYNPVKDELFEAEKGKGAFRNGQRAWASEKTSIKDIRMIGYPRKFRRLGWPDMNVSVRNSMAYRMVLVACGAADATVSFTPKSDWDLAAAGLIAAEAGAIVTNLVGNAFNYAKSGVTENGVICASPALHALLLTQVNSGAAGIKPQTLETRMADRKDTPEGPSQLLHLVIGGELVDPMKTEFIDLKQVVFKGAYPNYQEARDAWLSAAQSTVDNAHMRFFILHAHELIDPDNDGIIG